MIIDLDSTDADTFENQEKMNFNSRPYEQLPSFGGIRSLGSTLQVAWKTFLNPYWYITASPHRYSGPRGQWFRDSQGV